MDLREETTLTVAEIVMDCEAMSCAALARDFEEARFRAELIVSKSRAAGLRKVVAAAKCAIDRLGPPGGLPHPGYGKAILDVASALDVIWFEPL